MRRAALFLAFLFLCSAPAHADIEYWKVVEVTGLVETRGPLEAAWTSLTAPSYMKKGSLLRTGRDSSAELILNRQWGGALHLDEGSELEFPENSPQGVRLRKGSLFVLLENDRPSEVLSIFSPGATVFLASGGVALSMPASGARLRVFSESADIAGVPGPVEEGWEWDAGQRRRMEFSDYDDWQKWFRKNYERKDRYFLKRSA